MFILWVDHYILLLVTFIWSRWKTTFKYDQNFYRRFVDDIYSRRKVGNNVLFNRLLNYHLNIKLTSKFKDTKLTNISGFYKFNVYRKSTKLPSPWSSKTPKCYKRNTINGDLHHSKRIPSNFDHEFLLIKEKLMKTDYLLRFIISGINEFPKCKDHGDENFVIPPNLFGITKPFISIEMSYC